MKKIQQQSVDVAFERGEVQEVEVVRKSDREWYFTFTAEEPISGKPVQFTLLTQQGELRTWADPRRLFRFLSERGVRKGTFILNEDDDDVRTSDESSKES
mgnify:CR=1 FL=1